MVNVREEDELATTVVHYKKRYKEKETNEDLTIKTVFLYYFASLPSFKFE